MNCPSRGLVAALALAGGACFLAFAGPLDPPAGPVAPSYKTLSQIEPRVDANTLPSSHVVRIIISQPGSYYLSANVTGASGIDGIVIQADNVTLDLNGFSVIGAPGSGYGISVPGTHSNITIRNGVVRGWAGDGFNAADDQNVRLESVTFSNNTVSGAVTGRNAIVDSCIAASNSLDGFQVGEGGVIRKSTASANLRIGISVDGGPLLGAGAYVQGCTANHNGSTGINASRAAVENCAVGGNGVDGIAVAFGSVSSCVSRQNSVNGFSGQNTRFTDCSAISNSGDGFHIVSATVVESCFAQGNTGDGIECDREVTIRSSHVADSLVGIRITQNVCRIEDNSIINCHTAVLAGGTTSRNVIVGNRATSTVSGNGFNVAAGNFLGTVVTSEADMNAASNPLVNVSY
jgi:hypothetical protein